MKYYTLANFSQFHYFHQVTEIGLVAFVNDELIIYENKQSNHHHILALFTTPLLVLLTRY